MADAPAHDAATLAFYAAEAPTYVARGWDGLNPDLAVFLNRLRPGARILELGCGSGRDAVAMLARGFAVDATDGSPEMAREAGQRIGRPVRVMRFDALAAHAEYDAVWANAALLHVPRPALLDVLTRVHRALKPGGHHFASYKGGTREGRDEFGRYFNYPTPDYLRATYRAAGDWSAFDLESGTGAGYDKRVTPWHTVRATRR
jgi:SAM-dependent methyltransferase